MKDALLFILGIVLLVSEGVYANVTVTNLNSGQWVFVLHILVIYLIYIAWFSDKWISLIYALLFGLIFDISNAGIIGIYAVILPVVVYGSLLIKDAADSQQVMIVNTVAIGAIVVVEILVYLEYMILGQIHVTLPDFLLYRLGPTLLFNTVIALIFGYPFMRLCKEKSQFGN